MVELRIKKYKTGNNYTLEHSIREEGRVYKVRKSLGKNLPKNIELVKKQFYHQIFMNNMTPILKEIKKAYSKHEKTIPKSAKEKEIENFAIKFTYETQKIEGSTLTLRDTANLLQKGLAPKKSIRDVKEAQAHRLAFYEMLNEEKNLILQLILKWHKMLFSQTKEDIAGKVRKHQVAISGSKFIPLSPIEVDVELKEFFKWYNKNKSNMHPVELAALTHLKFVTIHPFSDGNGRISRLMMNFVLHKNKFPLFSISYLGRDSYYTALERAQIKSEEIIFIRWFIKKYIKEMKKMKLI